MISIKILGTVDLITAILFYVFIVFDITGLSQIITFLGIFLLVKGIVFATTLDMTSVLDIISAMIIIVGSTFNIHIILVISLIQTTESFADGHNFTLTNAGRRIRTLVSTKLTRLERVPFDHSGIPAYSDIGEM